MTRVLVTGATGFIGRMLCPALTRAGFKVRAAVRADAAFAGDVEPVRVGDIVTADWAAALHEVRYVVHAAARAHAAQTSEELYLATNARATQRLAEAAARAGVARFVYLSTVKVHGEGAARSYTERDPPAPQDAYGRSKLLGERAALAAAGRMEVVIVRPPLVYGPEVRANFLRLLGWVDREWPLPLAAVDNRRSLVSVWNLCDFLCHVLAHPAAAGRVWLTSDGEDLGTPELVRRIAHAMQRRSRLLAVPVPLLRVLGTALGRRAEVERLCDSLTVDVTAARTELSWAPATPIDVALAHTVEWYLRERAV